MVPLQLDGRVTALLSPSQETKFVFSYRKAAAKNVSYLPKHKEEFFLHYHFKMWVNLYLTTKLNKSCV